MIKHYLNGLLTYEISFTKLNSKFLSIFFFQVAFKPKKMGLQNWGVEEGEGGGCCSIYTLKNRYQRYQNMRQLIFCLEHD